MTPSEIQPVIDSLKRRGRLPADIPRSTREEIAKSLTRYFNWVGQTKVKEMSDAAADVARLALKTEQEVRPNQSLTTTVGESPATARGLLTDFVESMGPEHIAETMNVDFFLRIPQEVAAGAAQYMAQNFDQTRVDEFPALELVRVYDRVVPRGFRRGPKGVLLPDPDNDWPTRFEAACNAAGDDDALAAFQKTGRMVALKDSAVWQALGDGAGGYEDTLGNPYAPFAFNSGYDTDEVDREDAEGLGLLDPGEPASPAKLDFSDLLNVPEGPVEARYRANLAWRQLHAGDLPGHDFRGNQWTDAESIPVKDIGYEWKRSEAEVKFDIHKGVKSTTKGPIVIDEKNNVIDGAHRLEEAKQRGDTHIDAIRVKRADFEKLSTKDGREALGIKEKADNIRHGKEFDDWMDKHYYLKSRDNPSTDLPLTVKVIIKGSKRGMHSGQVLVLKDSRSDWHDLPGGHVHEGENPKLALEREVLEETGLTLYDIKPLGAYNLKLDDGDTIVLFYEATNPNDPTLSDEHSAYGWATPDNLDEFNLGVFRPAVAEALGAQVEAGDFEGHPFRGNQYEKMVIGRIINGEDVESKDVTAAAEEGDLAATEHPPQWQSESAKRWKVVGDDKVVWTQRPTQIEKEMTEDHLERKHGIKVGRHTVWTEVGA